MKGEDPRYRVWHNPQSATFEDLLAVLISHGQAGRGVMELSLDLSNLAGNEAGLFELEPDAIASIKGMGPAKASVILAALELGRRKGKHSLLEGESLVPENLAAWLSDRVQGLGHECFYLFTFNRNFRLIRRHLVSRGTLDTVKVYYRDLLRLILHDRCAGVIIAHNHPDERALPGRVDLESMETLDTLLEPLGVRLLDQYIAGRDGVYSCRLDHYLLRKSPPRKKRNTAGKRKRSKKVLLPASRSN